MTTELIKADVFKQIIDTTPTLVIESEGRVIKAETRGNELLKILETKGMSDALDAELNHYQVLVKKTYDLIKDKRVPITGLFDDVKKMFTALENRIDPKSKDNIYGLVQSHRNQWAEKKAQALRQEQLERERKLQAEKVKIELTGKLELFLKQRFLNFVEDEKTRLTRIFNAITLQTFDHDSEFIKAFSEVYLYTHFENIVPGITDPRLTPDEINNIWINVKLGKFDLFVAEFKSIIKEKKDYYIIRLQSKYTELHQIANAARIDAELLQHEAEKRKAEELEKAQKESQQLQQQAVIQAQTTQSVLEANTLFDAQTTTVQVPSQVREGFEITVTHPAGYQLIIAKYFEKEGLALGIDALEKKTLGSMKKFCEKLALSDERIVSPYIIYKETFKAIVKK